MGASFYPRTFLTCITSQTMHFRSNIEARRIDFLSEYVKTLDANKNVSYKRVHAYKSGGFVKTIEEDIRSMYPRMARCAKTSAVKAARMMCLSCMGGSHAEIEKCTHTHCFLYPHRFGTRPVTAERRGKNVAIKQRRDTIKEKIEKREKQTVTKKY